MNSTPKTGGGVWVTRLLTQHFDDAALKKGALRCVKALREPGQSHERYASYLGGRTALANLLDRAKVDAWVEPNPTYGYLQLIDATGQPIRSHFVNVSHTSGFVAAALATSPIGIDVEVLTRDASRVAERVSQLAEWKALPVRVSVAGGEVPGSLAMWCAKEAVSKALGLGVVFGMKAFRIDFSSGNPATVHLEIQGPLTVNNPAVWLEMRSGYLFALCAEAPLFEEGIHWQE